MNHGMHIPVSIRVILGREFCEKLVQAACLTVGCNCLITDENGIILASDMQERIGTFHEASVEVIASGKNAYHSKSDAERLSGTLPGMTIPLFLEDHVIGTIGLTGSPGEVSRYAELMQQMSQVFMAFQNQQRTSAQMDSRKQNLLREIVSFDTASSRTEDICIIGAELGYNLLEPRTAVVFRCDTDAIPYEGLSAASARAGAVIRRVFPGPEEFICAQNDTEWVALLRLAEGGMQPGSLFDACVRIESELRGAGFPIQAGIGGAASSPEELKLSYDDACFAIRVLRAGLRPGSVLCADALTLERLASALPEESCARAAGPVYSRIRKAQKSGEVLELIGHWCRLRFRFTDTAEALHIHKSTLTYRFQRIRDTFGLDLYNTEQVLSVFLLDIHYRLT